MPWPAASGSLLEIGCEAAPRTVAKDQTGSGEGDVPGQPAVHERAVDLRVGADEDVTRLGSVFDGVGQRYRAGRLALVGHPAGALERGAGVLLHEVHQ